MGLVAAHLKIFQHGSVNGQLLQSLSGYLGDMWPLLISTLFFGFQLVLKIQEIFDSKRGKKRVKLVAQTGKEVSPARGIDFELCKVLLVRYPNIGGDKHVFANS